MLGKMLIHGLVAAALIGSAAAVYAQAKDNTPPKPAAPAVGVAQDSAASAKAGGQRADNGYLVPGRNASALDDRHRKASERRHDGRRHHDDDDD